MGRGGKAVRFGSDRVGERWSSGGNPRIDMRPEDCLAEVTISNSFKFLWINPVDSDYEGVQVYKRYPESGWPYCH